MSYLATTQFKTGMETMQNIMADRRCRRTVNCRLVQKCYNISANKTTQACLIKCFLMNNLPLNGNVILLLP